MPLDSIAVFSVLDRVTNSDGTPVSEGTVEFYLAGTTTPLTVYSDYGLTTSLGATVSLNSAGYPVSGGGSVVSVYTGTAAYKIIVKDSDGVTISDLSRDNIRAASEIPTTSETALPEVPVVVKTAAYSVVDADQGKLIVLNCTGGAFLATLPSAVTVGDGWSVGFLMGGTANTTGFKTISGQTVTIRGKELTSVPMATKGEVIWVSSDGANYRAQSVSYGTVPGVNTIIVTDRLTAPPTSPSGGAAYIINGTPTGAWSTLSLAEDQIAIADGNGSWIGYTPSAGWRAWVVDETVETIFDGSNWVDQDNTTAPASTTLAAAVFEHSLANGTVGGTATTAAWTTRTINTTQSNTITGCSLASNQITLPVGTYLLSFWQSLVQVSGSQSRIKVISGTATPDPILNGYALPYGSDSAGHTPGHIAGPVSTNAVLTVTATAVIELQYWVAGSSGGTSALGAVSAEPTGSNEVYARVAILSLAAQQGPTGSQGAQGADGLDAAYDFQWNTATSGDPGAGKLLLNHATFASATQLHISETTASAADIAAILATWDDSTSSVRAQVKWSKEGSPGIYRAVNITGAGTDQGTYWTFPITPVDDAGALSNSDDIAVLHIRTGDKGDTGATGDAGATGDTGLTGATGPNTGLDYAFNTATSGDPGSGKLLFDNATPASVTAINISKTGRNAESLGTLIGAQDDSTNTAHRGHIRIFTVSDRTKFLEAEYTSTFTDNTTYWTIAVSSVSASGSLPANNDVLAVMFERTGNKGTDGVGTGDVVGPAASVDGEVALYDSTTGKLLKRATTTGILKATSGVLAAAAAGTDYVAPGGALGTPASGTLTNATGLPISTGVSGLGANVATFLGTPSSANLAAALTDETGSGAAVFATSPTLVTPALGTPSSGTLTNCTGLPQAGTVGLTTADSPQFAGVNVGHASDTPVTRSEAGVIAVAGVPVHPAMPQNSQSAAYTLVLSDAQKHILHPTADNNARTFTIPANSSVAYPIGTCITFINEINTVTIAITTDTMKLAGAGTTGSRTLAANGMATAIKTGSTTWWISGVGLT